MLFGILRSRSKTPQSDFTCPSCAPWGRSPLKPYEYSRFCDLYARWKKTLGLVMRQVFRAGEKVFIDYSGKRPRLVDPNRGEVTEVELFVAVLGASNYTFAEATRSQKLADFVGSTIRAFQYFGAVPEIVVPDQLRSAVPAHCPPSDRSLRPLVLVTPGVGGPSSAS
jgi:transposase